MGRRRYAVDRHNSLPKPHQRFLRSGWIWKTALTIFIIGPAGPSVMRLLLTILCNPVGRYLMMTIRLAVPSPSSGSQQITYLRNHAGTEGGSLCRLQGQPELLENRRAQGPDAAAA